MGGGYITNYLHQKGLNSIGIDFSSNMIEIAKQEHPNVEFRNINIVDLDNYLEENSVDGIVAIYSLYFIPRKYIDKTLNAISRVLKNGGKLLMVSQKGNGEQYLEDTLTPEDVGAKPLFVNLYQKEELVRLLEKHGFIIDSFREVENTDPNELSSGGRFVISITNEKEKKVVIDSISTNSKSKR